MNAKTKQEIEKRMSKLPKPTPEQLNKLEDRIKKHRGKHGTLDHRGVIGNIIKLFQ